MTLTEFYAAVGGSYEDASARLQNDAFIGRFLRMLPRDDNMARLTAAVAEACTAMTEALRGSAVMPDNVRALHDAVAREYALVTETLSQLEA